MGFHVLLPVLKLDGMAANLALEVVDPLDACRQSSIAQYLIYFDAMSLRWWRRFPFGRTSRVEDASYRFFKIWELGRIKMLRYPT